MPQADELGEADHGEDEQLEEPPDELCPCPEGECGRSFLGPEKIFTRPIERRAPAAQQAGPAPQPRSSLGDSPHDASYGNDNFPAGVSFPEIPEGLGGLVQWVRPVDDRLHLARLEKLAQDGEILGRDLRDEERHRLAAAP